MKNINQYTAILAYPKHFLEEGQELSPEQITSAIEDHTKFVSKFEMNEAYFNANNTFSTSQKAGSDNPSNKIVAPYARTMVQTVVGYAFKPGLISYRSNVGQLNEKYKSITVINRDNVKNAELGEDQAKYGVGFQLLWTKKVADEATPTYSRVDPKEIIPIYNYDIEETMIAAIRYFQAGETTIVEVYYPNIIKYYKRTDDGLTILKEDAINFFKEVPLVLYKNNKQFLADYEPVRSLIDLYDKMLSDSANEMDRFAAAYLILQNVILGENTEANKRKLKAMKESRVFQIREDGNISFLTKEIPTAFFEMLKDTIREDIEYHSHIPDFRSKNFEAKSGEAMKYALIDFENLVSSKEYGFKEGLERRNDLINNILNITDDTFDNDFTIVFKRNLPANTAAEAEVVSKLNGILSKRTQLGLLTEIVDVEAELEQIKKEFSEENSIFED